MPKYIIKLNNKYLEWSTIVDAPTTEGMTLSEFREYYKQRYGTSSMDEFADRMQRVDETGTSSLMGESLDSLISGNRAGEGETTLTKEEIIKQYCGG